MNRKYKFRAWLIEEKRFIEPYKFNQYENTIEVYESWRDTKYERSHKCILEQFTGQKDKNGVEIYENDVIIQDGITGVVVYLKYGYFIEWKQNDKARISLGAPHTNDPNNLTCAKIEVIGNIHESPELLNDK